MKYLAAILLGSFLLALPALAPPVRAQDQSPAASSEESSVESAPAQAEESRSASGENEGGEASAGGSNLHFGIDLITSHAFTYTSLDDTARFNGFKLSLTLTPREGVGFGMVAESGILTGGVHVQNGLIFTLDGDYRLLGAILEFNKPLRISPGGRRRAFFELLHGGSDVEEVAGISIFRMGFSDYSFGNTGVTLGGTLGLVYLLLEKDSGLERSKDDLDLLLSLFMGYLF